MITLDIEKIISFYDDKKQEDHYHVSAITGVTGEDLGAGLIKHYLQSTNHDVDILNENVTIGTLKGNRLDRWILASKNEQKYLYQTEIKNWSSHSMGAKKIDKDCSLIELVERANLMYKNIWIEELKNFRDASVSKVFSKMKPPNNHSTTIIPLVCFWFPINPPTNGNKLEPFFELECNSDNFQKVCIFSMSIYLRSLLNSGKKTISIEAPNIEIRVKQITSMFMN